MLRARRNLVAPKNGHEARLRLRRRFSPLAAVLPTLRLLSTASLITALIFGGYRFFTQPNQAGALEFTPHVVGTATQAVGVLGMAAADMDADGDIDIVTGGSDGIKVYIHQANNVFEQKIMDSAKGERVQIIDLDGDGDLDVLATLKQDPSVKWYRNNGGLEFSGTLIGTGTYAKAYAGDINGDGANDIVTAIDESGLIVLRRWMNNGSGTFASTSLSSDSGVTAVTIGDINGNGYRDIVTGGSKGLQNWDTSNGLTWALNDIDSTNKNKTHIVIGDVNGASGNDIVTGDQGEDTVAVYRHIEHSTFERIKLTGAADATTVQIIDIDEDGDEDIIAAGQDDNNIWWFSNDGSEEFSRSSLATGLQSVFSVAVIDIDNDNDFDFVTGDHFQGTVYWYERTRAKPQATAPDNIQQTVDGAGRITFDTTVSDGDRDATRLRIQYSLDGTKWYKPWLLSAKPAVGSVDLKNSNGYQVGTGNPIDTNSNTSVKLTLLWDTKSVNNTGGPIKGDVGTVQLRVIPRDSIGNGPTTTSQQFRVDNQPPQGLSGWRITAIDDTSATLSWDKPTDSSSFSYKIYYGTNHADVLNQTSDVWDSAKDAALDDQDTTSTTINDLTTGGFYTFKLFVEDKYGNETAPPSIRGSASSISETPIPSIGPTIQPTPTITPFGATPTPTSTPITTFDPNATASPTAVFSPTLPPTLSGAPSPTPSTNNRPVADAGLDQAVNPAALVILDGGASYDPDGDLITYKWQQLAGPTVNIISEQTSTPSFSAGDAGETYIFSLTVRDDNSTASSDTVTIATKDLPAADTIPVDQAPRPPVVIEQPSTPVVISNILQPANLFLFVLALASTLLSLIERLIRYGRDRQSRSGLTSLSSPTNTPKGKVVHYRTNEPIAGAQVLIYGADGKLRARDRTNNKGEFATLFPVGQYTIGVQAPGFTFAPSASQTIGLEGGIVYTGGKIAVRDNNKAIAITVPMKPTGQEISSLRIKLLHIWQAVQRVGRYLSWPVFIIGALTNTFLIFFVPSGLHLAIEVLYVVLVIVKVALEVRVRPAYGLVRDAITHVPLDLAVVRLFEQGTNRIVMTRVTNGQGKFFALPPSGTYTITVTKPGYGVFSKDKVAITGEQDSVLQMTADLMPIVPQGGLQAARAAVL